MFGTFFRRPQQVWFRKAMFQVHLWVGLFLAIYVILIGVSGSILVFRQEFQRWTGLNPKFEPIVASGPDVGFAGAIAGVRQQFPKAKLSFIYPPRTDIPAYMALGSIQRSPRVFYVHPYRGNVLLDEKPSPNWLSWVSQLHFFLLLGRDPGYWLNGIGSALLLLMTLTGLVIWWQGIANWARGFVIDLRLNWKRVNWDLHNVAGFWTLTIVAFWAISGVYFVWPEEFTNAVRRISPVSIASARGNRVNASENTTGEIRELPKMVLQAAAMLPGTHVGAISLPATTTAPLQMYMVKNGRESLSGADFIFFDSATSKYLETAMRSNPKSLGDWLIWSMGPVHFGTQWGMTVKILWFILGLVPALLAVTGIIMYWNRYLSKKWHALVCGQRQPVDISTEETVRR